MMHKPPVDLAVELYHPPARSIAAAFGEGLAAPWLGFRHMARHPGLWRYGVVPVLLNLLITTLLLVALIGAVLLHRRLIGL